MPRLFPLLVSLMLTAVGCVTVPRTPPSVDLKLQLCEKGLREKPADRRQCFEDWLLENPKASDANRIRYALANDWAAAGNPARARELVDDILRNDPANSLAKLLRDRIANLRPVVRHAPVRSPQEPQKRMAEPLLRLQVGTSPRLHMRILRGTMAWAGASSRRKLKAGRHLLQAPGQLRCLDDCLWQSGEDLFRNGVEWDGRQWFTTLPIERYLEGVVGAEMATGWPMEALKAQAVVSRTYAWAYYADVSNPIVLQPTTYHQVYKGKPAASDIRRAVRSTRGEVLTWQGAPIIAYFHADNGGFSERPRFVWGDALPYFRLVTDSFSDQVPRWDWIISKKKFKRLLQRKLLRRGEVIRKVRLKRHHHRRVYKVLIETNQRTVEVSGNDFRLQMGPRRLKSLWFRIFPEGDNYRFSGQGYGHGVGLSQWGARRRAEAGQKYRQILRHYYFGVKEQTLW